MQSAAALLALDVPLPEVEPSGQSDAAREGSR